MVRCSPEVSQTICIYIAVVSPISVAHTTDFGESVYCRLYAQATCFKQADSQIGVSKFARNRYTGGSGANYAEITFNIGAQFNFAGV
jgi:hypothetical protein